MALSSPIDKWGVEGGGLLCSFPTRTGKSSGRDAEIVAS